MLVKSGKRDRDKTQRQDYCNFLELRKKLEVK